jgi:S1-C subfamily serine protease
MLKWKIPTLLLALFSCLVLQGQAADNYERSNQVVPKAEQAVIDANRVGASPRPTRPRGELDARESARVKVFKQVKPSVVHITSATKKILGAMAVAKDKVVLFDLPPGTGTGFVWDDKGHVVTNHHVIEVDIQGRAPVEAEDLQVRLPDGKSYKARVIGGSLQHDIAVLQVFAPLKDLKPIAIGRSRDLEVGQSVLAIGNPWGLDHTLTEGIVSALGREIETDPALGRRIRGAIQTDAAINPGNSGGPLLNSSGRLVGMNTSIQSTSGASAGIGFAIPVDTLNRIVPILIARGQLNRPVLGFTTLPDSQATELGLSPGAVIASVDAGGAAETMGFRASTFTEAGAIVLGDVIIGFQGHPVSSAMELFDFMDLQPANEVLRFEVLREGKSITLKWDPKLQPPKPAKAETLL